MIKITLKNLLDVAHSGALNRFLSIDKPVAVAWKNRRQATACNEEMKLYEERRLALCEKYGKKNEDKRRYEFDDANKLAFEAAQNELLDQVLDSIPGDPVRISDLASSKSPVYRLSGVELDVRLSENDLLLLEPFLTD